jgi:phage-related baseplate assembly protein
MWTLTPDYILQIKEELKGRRAAIEARIADDLRAVEAELAEIEQLEKIAYSVAVKHLPPLSPVTPADEPAVEVASLEVGSPAPAERPRVEPAPEMERGVSRWRSRVNQ